MTKVMIINGSPRKNFNTDKLLKEAARGVEEVGAEVEIVHLYGLLYKGCISCLMCKRKGADIKGLCFYKDALTPVLEKCLNADAVILGTPVYHSYLTGMLRSFMERFMFPSHTYMVDKEHGGLKRVLTHTLPVGMIMTMNVSESHFNNSSYRTILNENEESLRHVFGYAETLYAFDTYQFIDYAKYDCDLFDEAHKAKVRDEQFPKDMAKAYDMGKRLATMNKA